MNRILLALIILCLTFSSAFAGTPTKDGLNAEVYSISVSPDTIDAPGKHPEVAGYVQNTTNGKAVFSVTVTVTFPNKSKKTWEWNEVNFLPSQQKIYPLGSNYDISRPGQYQVEYSAYDRSKTHLISSSSKTFTVKEEVKAPPVQAAKEERPKVTKDPEPYRAAYAENVEGKLGIGIGIGQIAPKGDTVSGLDIDIDPGMFPVISITAYGSSPNYSTEISITRTTLDIKIEGYNIGELTMTPIQLTGQLRIPTGNLSTYFGAGVGYYFNQFKEDAALAGIDLTVGNSVGYHVNAGVDYFLTDHVAVNLDARYFWSQARATVTVPGLGSASDDVRLDSSIIGVGIKYFFDQSRSDSPLDRWR